MMMSGPAQSPMMSDPNGTSMQPIGGSSAAGGAAGSAAPPEAKPVCGNGMIEGDELCDGAGCLTECESSNACLVVTLKGSAATCDAQCSDFARITECASGDGCCPEGCKNADDMDCSKSCGDGAVDSPEKCEPTSQTQPCPTSCDDGKPSTMDILTGTAQQCSAECTHMPITAPKNGDDYCPPGANANNDDDCAPMCGNKVKESGEVCDGNCPTTCPKPSDACTVSEPKGSGCQVTCTERKLTASKGAKDGCCPPSANANTDSDCAAECGNGVTEPGEMCDANCPRGCGDSGQCSIGELEGAGTCNARCVPKPVGASGTTKDGRCCGKNGAEDADCPSKCGNSILEPGEACDRGARAPAGYTYDSWSCDGACNRLYAMAPCSSVSDCGPNAISCTTKGHCVTVRCTVNPDSSSNTDPTHGDCQFPNGALGRCINTDNCAPICNSAADCPSDINNCADFGPIALCDF